MKGDPAGWNERYRTADLVWTSEPNRFLPPEVDGLEPGAALDIACGEGRNAVWLATGGWKVSAVDFSEVGLAKGERLAASKDVDVDWVVGDVTAVEWDARFDLVVVFYLQVPEAPRRAAIVRATRALAPGGTLVVVGHDATNLTDGVGGPQDPSVLYTAEDLRSDVQAAGIADVEIERAETVKRAVDTGAGMTDAIDCLLRARRAT